MQINISKSKHIASSRKGAGSLDFVLVMAVILPLVLIVTPLIRGIIQLVYELSCTFLAWPFM